MLFRYLFSILRAAPALSRAERELPAPRRCGPSSALAPPALPAPRPYGVENIDEGSIQPEYHSVYTTFYTHTHTRTHFSRHGVDRPGQPDQPPRVHGRLGPPDAQQALVSVSEKPLGLKEGQQRQEHDEEAGHHEPGHCEKESEVRSEKDSEEKETYRRRTAEWRTRGRRKRRRASLSAGPSKSRATRT